MRNRAAALLILTLATGCSHSTQHQQRSTTPTTTATAVATGALPPLDGTSATLRTAPTSTGTRTATSTTVAKPPAPSQSDPASAATQLVEHLILGSGTQPIPDFDIWSGVVADGRIIQTTTLAKSADRATIAVSIAFDTPRDGTITEPIALRVEFLHTFDGWSVLAVGYL